MPRKQTLKIVEFTSYQTELEEKKAMDLQPLMRSDSLDQGTQQSDDDNKVDREDESGTEKEGTGNENATATEYLQLPLTPVTKQVQVNYVGVPQHLENVQGRVSKLTCGDFNTFCVIKL